MYNFKGDEKDRKTCCEVIPEVKVFGHVHLFEYIQ